MTGADCLLQTLVANGVDVCFMNPGTSEMHFVSALDRVPAMRGILCLYEGVCSGAADGYARMRGRPASVLLHLGPGLGNALSNLHNARKARSPVVVIVGEHSTQHLRVDAPLSSDIAAFARTVSREIRTVGNVETIGREVRDTVAAATAAPGGVAALIVPADFSWLQSASVTAVATLCPRPAPSPLVIERIVQILQQDSAAVFILGGLAIGDPRTLIAAERIAGATGARFFADRTAPRLAAGRGRFPVQRVPYFPEDARAALANFSHLILVEADAPVSFFGYPNTPSSPVAETCQVTTLAERVEDGRVALECVAANFAKQPASEKNRPPIASVDLQVDAPLTLDSIGRALAALMPDNSVVSDEMVSSRDPILSHLRWAAPHDQLTVTGGSIGQGLPVAVGAAVACPERTVIALEGDGSAMYSFQALWTMAREELNIITIILANRRYRILDIEMRRTGASANGVRANAMLDLSRPDLDFVSLARGLGVAATRAVNTGEFVDQLRRALEKRGPHLIEAIF